MSKKKRFGISEALTRGLSETIHVVENNAGIFRNVIVPLSRIELDPDNPRKLAVSISDIQNGFTSRDPLYAKKQEELEKLKELAHTIKASGVINPIVVYKLGEVYRVIAGERRCLASFIAGKQDIEARVFNEKPKAFELKLIQWIENTAREDLNLDERLDNVREIIKEYQNQNGRVEVTATLLKNITGLSLTQCSYYLAVMNAPKDVQMHIQDGNIRNLDKAALLSNIKADEVREHAIEACINGSSLKELRSIVSKSKTIKQNKIKLKTSTRGRGTAKVNMGTTAQAEVIKAIISSVLSQREFTKYTEIFTEVNWMDLRQAARAFRKMIEILEVETAV